MKKSTLFVYLFLSFYGIAQEHLDIDGKGSKYRDQRKARNIILMIGDGMGVAQIYAGLTANKGHLNLERITNIGFSKTYSSNDYITDSGAGATAISTGNKTYNGAIGVNKDSIPCKTILEYAEDHGKSTALIASSTITHATPASFIAHQKSRKNDEEIAKDFLKTDIDVFFGGGLNHFNKRNDAKDLTAQLIQKGYQMVYSPDSIKYADGNKIAGLLYPGSPPKYSEGRGNMLMDGSLKAIEILSKDDDGFFMMIEGSQIDWGGHDNDTKYIIDEMLDFDNTIGKILDFAEKDGNTLVVITADHETGGMGLVDGNISAGDVKAKYTGGDHTGVMVPVFSFGPGSENFKGIFENTELFYKMMKEFGFNVE
jgi:alkaline phosphatase